MLRLMALAGLLLAQVQSAAGEPLQLSAADFLIGEWAAPDPGQGPNKGGTSSIQPDLQTKILLRRDHVVLREGGTMDLMMPIYIDGGKLCADFYDSEGHAIHYAAAEIVPHHRISFVSEGPDVAPAFRLTYELIAKDELAINFEIAPPGASRIFKTFSSGHVKRRAGVN